MNMKSIAIAAAFLALAPAIASPILGGQAQAAVTGPSGPSSSSSSSTTSGPGGVEPGVPSAACVPQNYRTHAEVQQHLNDKCPKSISVRIGSFRLI